MSDPRKPCTEHAGIGIGIDNCLACHERMYERGFKCAECGARVADFDKAEPVLLCPFCDMKRRQREIAAMKAVGRDWPRE